MGLEWGGGRMNGVTMGDVGDVKSAPEAPKWQTPLKAGGAKPQYKM